MAYTILTPYTSGQVPFDSKLNQVRDNFNALRRFKGYGVQLGLADDVPIANSTYSAITWSTVFHQTGNMWVSGTATRIIARVSGRYTVVALAEWHDASGGERTLSVEKTLSGGGTVRYDFSSQGSNAGSGSQCGMDVISMAVNDYLRVMVFHSQGAPLDLRGNGMDRTNVFCYLQGGP